MAAKFKAYRNLHKLGFFSIMHKNKVIGHSEELIMHNCRFHISEKRRLRVCEERKKNLHAFVVGETYDESDTKSINIHSDDVEEVWYSPYFTQHFYGLITGKIYIEAKRVLLVNNKSYVVISENA